LALGIAVSFTSLADERYVLYGKRESLISVMGGIFTMAHLFIVIFRAYANPAIFKRHTSRFIWTPVILFTAMMLSSWVLVFIFVLAVWWDVYHSSLQTFGLARIYDKKEGNDPKAGRWLDKGINLLLYLGPVLGGVTLFDHIGHFDKFQDVGSAFFSVIPAWARAHHRVLTWATLGIGLPYFIFYVYSYWRMSQEGYRISRQKVLLLVSTGFCSVYTWGFNSFGQAFFIMNFFHALQYFALVWHHEKGNITSAFGMNRLARSWPAGLVFFLAISFGYGIWAKMWGESTHLAFSVLLTVSIMHFWYDGFVWSVSRREVG
jgi:hypothetical protein